MKTRKAPEGGTPQVQAPAGAEVTDPAEPLNPPDVAADMDEVEDEDQEADVNDRPIADAAIPRKLRGRPGVQILLEACAVFGVNPDPDARPRELLDFKHYPDPDDAKEDAVVLVTSGGIKLRYPIDGDTEHHLQRVLGLVTHEKQPDGTVKEVRKPLGDNLTLPKTAVDGLVPENGPHVHPGGYLRRSDPPKARRSK